MNQTGATEQAERPVIDPFFRKPKEKHEGSNPMPLICRRHFFRRGMWLPGMVPVVILIVVVVAHACAQTTAKKGLLDLADEAFSHTEGTAARKATEVRDKYAAMVESIVAASGIGETRESDRGDLPALERLRRASLPAGTHRGNDGTLIEVSGDGIARFTTPDKRVATVLPGGRRLYQPTPRSSVIDVDRGRSVSSSSVGDQPSFPESYVRVKEVLSDAADGLENVSPPGRYMKPEEYRMALNALDELIEQSTMAEWAARRRGDSTEEEKQEEITNILRWKMQRIARDRGRAQRGGLDPETQEREDRMDDLEDVNRERDRLRDRRRTLNESEHAEEMAEIDAEIDDTYREENSILSKPYSWETWHRRPGLPMPQDDRRHADPEDRTQPSPTGDSADADESDTRPDRFGTDRVDRLLDEPGEHASAIDWSNLAGAAYSAGGGDGSVSGEAGGDGGAGRENAWLVLREESRDGADNVVNSRRIPGTGVDVFVRESGAMQIRLLDGTVVTSQPDLGYVGVTDSDGRELPVSRRDDGLIQVGEGSLGMAIDPDTGRAFILNEASGGSSGAGQRIVVEPNGAYAYTDSESSFQAVRPDNSLDQAGYVDATTGANVRYDADTGETRIYTSEGVVAGVSTGSSGVFVNPASGGQLPVGGVLQPPAASGNPAAVSIWSTAQSEPPSQAPRQFPSSAELASQYIATAREMIKLWGTDDDPLRGIPQGEIDRMRQMLRTWESQTRADDATEATRLLTERIRANAREMSEIGRLAIAKIRADERAARADPDLAAIESQIEAAEAAIESTRNEARAKRDELWKSREEARAKIREITAIVTEGSTNLLLFKSTNSPDLEKLELADLEPRVSGAIRAAEQAAVGMIDYGKYDRCSNGRSWNECGGIDPKGVNHDAIKQRWLREQLLSAMQRVMGPALAAQALRVKALKTAIAEKEKKIDQKEKAYQTMKEDAERRVQRLEQEDQQLTEQLEAAKTALDKEIAEKEEALFNLKQERIVISLRPRRPKSDLQDFIDMIPPASEETPDQSLP